MLVSHKYEFIYIKTRKTASTSIEGLLEPLCAPAGHVPSHVQPFLSSEYGIIAGRAGAEKPDDPLTAHSPAQRILNTLGRKTFRSYQKIYAIRDPYDKVVSWFWHVMPQEFRDELQDDFTATRTLFRTWLLMRPVLPVDNQFYVTSLGRFKAFRIRYEHMHEDLEELAALLDMPIDLAKLPRWKTTTRSHRGAPVEAYYDDDTRAVVRKEFARDFEKFGYSP